MRRLIAPFLLLACWLGEQRDAGTMAALVLLAVAILLGYALLPGASW